MEDSGKIKKNYKLMGTESDPLIIAQRLLNLYRQLHIFSPEKKEAYNQMLLEQPPEVKRVLSSLPGGIVVQQYLADIEEENGFGTFSDDDDIQETPKAHVEKNNKNSSATVLPQSSITVANDPEMVKGIVEAVRDAIVTSNRHRKEDTKELAQTIIALQSKLTQTLMSNGNIPSAESQEGGVNSSSNLDKIISGISHAQSELIKEMTQAQTQELSQILSGVLKEIQQMSTQSLIDAVQTVHRENMDFFKNQIFSGVSSIPMHKKISEDQSSNKEEKSGHGYIDKIAGAVSGVFSSKNEGYSESIEDEAPIDLDNYVDNFQETTAETMPETTISSTAEPTEDNTDYEWEYGDDYEWEYVEDDGSEDSNDDYEYVTDTDAQEYEEEYEWEYVEDDGGEDSFDVEEQVDNSFVPESESSPDNIAEQLSSTTPVSDIEDNTPKVTSSNDNVDLDSIDSITLGDDFGLSSNDDIAIIPR